MPCWWIGQKWVTITHDQKISEGVDVVHPSRYDLYLLYRSMNWYINSFDTYHSKYRSITDVAVNIGHFGKKNKNWSVQIIDLHCESWRAVKLIMHHKIFHYSTIFLKTLWFMTKPWLQQLPSLPYSQSKTILVIYWWKCHEEFIHATFGSKIPLASSVFSY